jgi:hypothetical protein
MGLANIAGVFSRYFVVGFFLPAFFALVALSQTVSEAFLPPVYLHAGAGAQIAILGGAALPVGLLLLGLHYRVLRLYEGYPLAEHSSLHGVKQIHDALLSVQRWRFRRAMRHCDYNRLDEVGPFDAAWKLDRRFPHDLGHPNDETLLLPTAFGNAVRAFERHSFLRWHLNGIGVWPHVENLLTSQEAQVLADAQGDVAFFINSSLVAVLSALALVIDMVEDTGAPSPVVVLVPVAVTVLAYGAAIGAAANWGEVVRASIDLHRHELYEKLGLRPPRDFKEERQIAWHVNRTLLVGLHLPDEYAAVVREGRDIGVDANDHANLIPPSQLDASTAPAPPVNSGSPRSAGLIATLVNQLGRRSR